MLDSFWYLFQFIHTFANMKKIFLLILISSILTACGFQQRKYTHGYWGNHIQHLPMEDSDGINVQMDEPLNEVDQPAIAPLERSEDQHPVLSKESEKWGAVDTVIPADTAKINEEEFMYYGSEKIKEQRMSEAPIDPSSVEGLTKEVSENVLWGVLSMLGIFLYFVGIIPGTIYFFKALKTQKKLKAMGDSGIYRHLRTMNLAAILANGFVFSMVAITVLILLIVAIATIAGNF
jgi:hypothetical protein